MPWPQAVVFDFDGLLADTAACWHQAYAQTLASQGRRLDAAIVARLTGASVQDAADRLKLPASLLLSGLDQAFRDQPPPLMPGAHELVTRLAARLPLAVATNAPAELVREALLRTGLLGHFVVIVGADPPRKAKPAPDVYLAACRELGVQPAQAAALEDSPVGVMAARQAGLTVIMVSPEANSTTPADLHVPRLDHPHLLRMLPVPQQGTTGPTGTSRFRSPG